MIEFSLMVALILSLLYLKVLRYKFKSNFFLYIFVLFYCLVFYVIPIVKYGGSNWSIIFSGSKLGIISDDRIIYYTVLYSIVFLIFVTIGYTINSKGKVRKRKVVQEGHDENLDSSIKVLITITSILSICGVFGAIYFSGMSINQLLTSSRFSYWETRNVYARLISGYFVTLISVASFLAGSNKTKTPFIFYLAFLVANTSQLVLYGSRGVVLSSIGAFALGKFNLLRFKRKGSSKKIFYFGILGGILFHLGVVWQYVRWTMRSVSGIKEWIGLLLFDAPIAYRISIERGDLAYFFDAAVTSLDVVPRIHDFLYGTSYVRLLLLFVPQSIFHIKPEETQRIFASIISPETYHLGTTLPPSIIGDSYLNFGFFGVFIGLFFGFMLSWMDKVYNGKMTIKKIAIGSGSTGFILYLMRGTFNGIFPLIFMYLMLIIIISILRLVYPKSMRDFK